MEWNSPTYTPMVHHRYGRTEGTGRTDRQTDGRLTIGIPRFALRASRGKKRKVVQKLSCVVWTVCQEYVSRDISTIVWQHGQ